MPLSWLFETNKSMVASRSEIPRNHLLEQVLRLVYSLVNFGYYGDTEDIQKLLQPMLSLMDGRNDKPERYPQKDDSALTSQVQQEIEKFRNYKRFRLSPENTAVTDAKFHLHKIASRHLSDIFKETNYFGQEFVDILQDLLNYQREKIVSQALLLFNRFFTAHENLFRKCIDTQLLITETSCGAMKKIIRYLPKLKQLKKSKWSPETLEKIVDILNEFTRLCCLETDVREYHPQNQEMLYNYGILGDMFDFLQYLSNKSSETLAASKKNSAFNKAENQLLKCVFRFLKALARKNVTVQQRLFDRLDYFIETRGAEAELGEMMVEIFSSSLSNCLKIDQKLIRRIASLYSETFHPVWLSVLGRLVVTDVFPIKRNQNLVMKALMTYQSSLSIITDTDSATKIQILKQDDSVRRETYNSKHRLCTLVHLVSICAKRDDLKSIQRQMLSNHLHLACA